MADDEPHAVVRLLLKRMESHPEEFRVADEPFHYRWYDHVDAIQAFGSEADKAAMDEGLREIRLAEVHERVMDELVNGPERRRKEREEREYERQMLRQGGLMQQQAYQQQLQGYQQAYGGGGGGGAGIVGQGPNLKAGLTTGSISVAPPPEPTLSSSTINAIKKALGKGK
jgi:hypothetical protein